MVAPLLRDFQITNFFHFGPEFLQFLPRLPWEQLTSLSLTGEFTFSDVRKLLSWCTSLERCHLDHVSGIWSGISSNPIDLPHLKALWIIFSSLDSFQALYMLHMPSLSSLTTNLPLNTSEILEGFTQFMATFQHTLREQNASKPTFRYAP